MTTVFSIQISRMIIGIVLSPVFLLIALFNSREATANTNDGNDKRSLSSTSKQAQRLMLMQHTMAFILMAISLQIPMQLAL